MLQCSAQLPGPSGWPQLPHGPGRAGPAIGQTTPIVPRTMAMAQVATGMTTETMPMSA